MFCYKQNSEDLIFACFHLFTVANKVALLIGNMDYQHGNQLGQLFHPINDVCGLMGSLLNMNGFKVSYLE